MDAGHVDAAVCEPDPQRGRRRDARQLRPPRDGLLRLRGSRGRRLHADRAAGPRGPGAEQLVHGVAACSFIVHGNTIPSVLLGGAPNFRRAGRRQTNSFRRWFEVGRRQRRQRRSSRWWTCSAWRTARCAAACATPSATRRSSARASRRAEIVTLAAASGCGTSCARTGSPTRRAATRAAIPTGTYQVAAGKEGFPYEGGGATPGNPPGHDHRRRNASRRTSCCPQTGRLQVDARRSRTSAPVPARVRWSVSTRAPSSRLIAIGDQQRRHADQALLRPHRRPAARRASRAPSTPMRRHRRRPRSSPAPTRWRCRAAPSTRSTPSR